MLQLETQNMEQSNPVQKRNSSSSRYFNDDKADNDVEDEKMVEDENKQKRNKRKDKFAGPAPINKEALKKYKRGEQNNVKHLIDKKHKRNLKNEEHKIKQAEEEAARAELLLTEEAGFLEADEGEETSKISQHELARNVDVTSAQKYFELKLDQFGPYRLDYTRNGRHLVIGGQKGHLASIDWVTKKLLFEINVMETIREVQWLHLETMLAVAQKKWLYIYDHQGTELHCVKTFNDVLRMEFLPYHFLLAATSSVGYLKYLDISVGKEISAYQTKCGRLNVMAQNPYNAIVHLGHSNGTVTMWSPNEKEPLVKMICHPTSVTSVAIDPKGLYMATSGQDRILKIFDVRTYKPLQAYKIGLGATELSFSQRGLLAAAVGNVVEIYKDCCTTAVEKAYMTHRCTWPLSDLKFCPYEDVLGLTHSKGFSSLLIPGAGEPNFDSLEANPYHSKRQRQQWEVKALLEKIQPELISLDPGKIGQVDKITMQQKFKEKQEYLGFDKPHGFVPKHKLKGRSSAGNRQHRRQKVADELTRQKVKASTKQKERKKEHEFTYTSALDRFKRK
ncbi:WD repeat-containing protein 46-like [Antedon mediterranea]|uniref:WD repeat-containing protein 46-like n=1 Tax=Antedon mediterranea TaxID=105859 RepID=UPI003AF7FEAB